MAGIPTVKNWWVIYDMAIPHYKENYHWVGIWIWITICQEDVDIIYQVRQMQLEIHNAAFSGDIYVEMSIATFDFLRVSRKTSKKLRSQRLLFCNKSRPTKSSLTDLTAKNELKNISN